MLVFFKRHRGSLIDKLDQFELLRGVLLSQQATFLLFFRHYISVYVSKCGCYWSELIENGCSDP